MTILKQINQEYKLLCEFNYEVGEAERGYNNRTLYINLSDNEIASKPVSERIKKLFIGGKGFDLWLLWKGTNAATKWDSMENEICISSGPLGGTTTYPGSGKSIVTTISPLTGSVVDSNVGGHFGPFLKCAGWDCLEIQGKAQNDIILVIDGDRGIVTINEALELPINTYEIHETLSQIVSQTDSKPKNLSIVTAGVGSETSCIGCLNFSWYDLKRKSVRLKQAGRGGIGSVFRNKKLKAIMVQYSGSRGNLNNPADSEIVAKWGRKINNEIVQYDDKQFRMRKTGTPYLVELANELEVLPVHNFKYGSHSDAKQIYASVFETKFTQGSFDGCWLGCTMSCCKAVDNYIIKTGPWKGKKVIVDGPEYETIAALGSNCGIFDPEHIIECNFYCDHYGIDTISFGTISSFLMECWELRLINKNITEGIELNFGNKASVLTMLHGIGNGEGFGIIAGKGIRKLKELFTEKYNIDKNILEDIGMESKGMEVSLYVTKECLAQQAGYGLANKGAHHDETCFLYNPYESRKELIDALFWYPMFRTWLSLCGLCKIVYNDIIPADNQETEDPRKIMSHVIGYAKYFSGVTGIEASVDDLIEMSERVYNFQRIFNLRQGYGVRDFDKMPYRAKGPVTEEEYISRQERYNEQLKKHTMAPVDMLDTSEKLKELRRYREEQYELFRDEIYERRGWNSNGIPTLETVKRLQIDFPEIIDLINAQ